MAIVWTVTVMSLPTPSGSENVTVSPTAKSRIEPETPVIAPTVGLPAASVVIWTVMPVPPPEVAVCTTAS